MATIETEIETYINSFGTTWRCVAALMDRREGLADSTAKLTIYEVVLMLLHELAPQECPRGAEISEAEIQDLLFKKQREEIAESAANRFGPLISNGYRITFTDGDLREIQDTVNDLRKLIQSDQFDFEDEHRQRLLGRLEEFQSELHKKVSNIDRFMGLVSDGAVIVEKFGKAKAKPIQKSITKIVRIGLNALARAEELPSSTQLPLLDEPEDEEDGDQ